MAAQRRPAGVAHATHKSRIKELEDTCNKKLKSRAEKEYARLRNMRAGAFAGALGAAILKTIAPETSETLNENLTETFAVTKKLAVGAGLWWWSGETKNAFLSGASAAASGVMVGESVSASGMLGA